MFGGKLHRVTCNAFEPDVRYESLDCQLNIEFQATKPFADFDGNWNAEYFWTIDKKSPAEFVDTRTISTKNKMVKALNQQEPTESRRLWREVTEEWISIDRPHCTLFNHLGRPV